MHQHYIDHNKYTLWYTNSTTSPLPILLTVKPQGDMFRGQSVKKSTDISTNNNDIDVHRNDVDVPHLTIWQRWKERAWHWRQHQAGRQHRWPQHSYSELCYTCCPGSDPHTQLTSLAQGQLLIVLWPCGPCHIHCASHLLPPSSIASWIPPTLFQSGIKSEHKPFIVPKVFNMLHGQHHSVLIVGEIIGFFSFWRKYQWICFTSNTPRPVHIYANMQWVLHPHLFPHRPNAVTAASYNDPMHYSWSPHKYTSLHQSM